MAVFSSRKSRKSKSTFVPNNRGKKIAILSDGLLVRVLRSRVRTFEKELGAAHPSQTGPTTLLTLLLHIFEECDFSICMSNIEIGTELGSRPFLRRRSRRSSMSFRSL